MYATIAITEMYGPETQVRLHSLHEERAAAEEAAEARPDHDPSVGCARLGHNQASETELVVGAARYWDSGNSAWDLATPDEEDFAIAAACEALDKDFDPNDVPEEYVLATMAKNGRYILQDPEEPAIFYLVETEGEA